MKKILMLPFLLISLQLFAENQSHTFNLNGKEIEVSDEFLDKIRSRMNATGVEIETSTLMNKTDVRWTLDYISLSEMLYSRGCDNLKLLNTRKFNPEVDIDKSGAKIVSGLFDYIWEVKVCEKLHNYRVVNEKGEPSFTVYPLEL